MFSVMLNVAMREGAFWDNNMHKEQCIGPGHGASPWWFPVCFSGSVYQQIHYCKQLVMGKSVSKAWLSGAILWTVFLLLSLFVWHAIRSWLTSGENNPRSRFGERRPRWCECGCSKCGDRSVAFFLFFVSLFVCVFLKSGLLCAV